MSNILGGPYSLYKLEGNDSTKYRSVISLCIMEENIISERVYNQGRLQNQDTMKQASFIEALSYMI